MPAKLDDASNLRFLYACMAHSNWTSINYDRVAHIFGIKGPAARMRFTRLREQLDPLQNIGQKHVKVSKAEARRQRQREKMKRSRKEGYESKWKGSSTAYGSPMDDDVDDEEPGWNSNQLKKEEEGENSDWNEDECDRKHQMMDWSPKQAQHISPGRNRNALNSLDRYDQPQLWNDHGPSQFSHPRPHHQYSVDTNCSAYPPPMAHMGPSSPPYYTSPSLPISFHANSVSQSNSNDTDPQRRSMLGVQTFGMPMKSNVPGAAFEYSDNFSDNPGNGFSSDLSNDGQDASETKEETADAKWEVESSKSSIGSNIHVGSVRELPEDRQG